MKFNSGTDCIVQKVRFECSADADDYTLEDIVMNSNLALDEVYDLATKAALNWRFDDVNESNIQIGYTKLVAGQSLYTFSPEFLTVDRVRIKDAATGKYSIIEPLKENGSGNGSEDAYQGNTGTPQKYLKMGQSFKLLPTPPAEVIDGIEVRFTRNLKRFTTASTTIEPGFASHLHAFVAYFAAREYCGIHKQDRLPRIERELQRLREAIISHYSGRAEDERPNMAFRTCSTR